MMGFFQLMANCYSIIRPRTLIDSPRMRLVKWKYPAMHTGRDYTYSSRFLLQRSELGLLIRWRTRFVIVML